MLKHQRISDQIKAKTPEKYHTKLVPKHLKTSHQTEAKIADNITLNKG